MNAAHAHDTWKELAGRENEGLEVFLLWNKSADRLKLVVADARLDEEFRRAGARGLLPPVRVRGPAKRRLRLCDARVPRSASAELKGAPDVVPEPLE